MDIEKELNIINSIDGQKDIRFLFINRLKIELNELDVNIEVDDNKFLIYKSEENIIFQIDKNKIIHFEYKLCVINPNISILDVMLEI